MLSGLESPVHLVILLIVILLVFGAKRLPEMGRSLGSGMREFGAGVRGESVSAEDHEPAQPAGLTQPDSPRAEVRRAD